MTSSSMSSMSFAARSMCSAMAALSRASETPPWEGEALLLLLLLLLPVEGRGASTPSAGDDEEPTGWAPLLGEG